MWTFEEKLATLEELRFPKTLENLETYLGVTDWLQTKMTYYAKIVEML